MALAYLLTEFRHAHQIHTYDTRHRDLLRLTLAKTVKYQGSFRNNGARTFNALLLVSFLVLTKCQVLNLRVSRSHDQVLQRAYYSSFILGSKITFCQCK